MNSRLFTALLVVLGAGFAAVFVILVLPPLLQNADVLGAFAGGFVNPFAAGYSLDVIFCWLILAVWVIYEAKLKGIRHGWVTLVLGVVPGVATGFAAYLLLRTRHEQRSGS
ncbi:DUF2834 domain-containing protein [Hydrocarboniclastica marina]|uniref:DUF2834 domain-containing protein n=1 Tax=Hydrocarboniclastica marina TaxID=2259620 RepID=A0A4P7XJB5_9ALTE|nr:DUF2834 domain-containing protein [Hydrocarboniclastica marina]MAL97294.1 hypothetical protein [Alteromonadaceae bacterium]QCF27196.1 DUF2834 domain-containing protein [Hydrocarboniclastica marina]|tara:strand:+ start:415 stop:747 length:333 start_codon:yes stop_codon:yes gene_type:complete